MNRTPEILQHVAEFLIIIVLTLGGLTLFFADPINTGGPVARFFGTQIALYVYGGVFMFEGLGLLYSKFFRLKRMHKHILLAVYLTMIFVTILEWGLLGWTLALIDQVVVGLLAAACWLRWKTITEYLSPKEIANLRHELKDIPQPPERLP